MLNLKQEEDQVSNCHKTSQVKLLLNECEWICLLFRPVMLGQILRPQSCILAEFLQVGEVGGGYMNFQVHKLA